MNVDLLPRALCRTAPDPDLWMSEDPSKQHQAKVICQGCPVRVECLEDAMANEPRRPLRLWKVSRHGAWGALTPRERNDLARQRWGRR